MKFPMRRELARRAISAFRGTQDNSSKAMDLIQRSKTGYQQTMGPQTQGDWSSPSDWNETMAEKQSHNWGMPGENK